MPVLTFGQGPRKPLARRTELSRGSSSLKRTRLAPKSDRRKEEDAGPWADLKALVLARDGERCQGPRFWPSCSCAGDVSVHHVFPTGRGGDKLCAPDALLTLCMLGHHRAVHGNGGKEGEMRGLIVPQWPGADALPEALELRLSWERYEPRHPSWWTEAERHAYPLPSRI